MFSIAKFICHLKGHPDSMLKVEGGKMWTECECGFKGEGIAVEGRAPIVLSSSDIVELTDFMTSHEFGLGMGG